MRTNQLQGFTFLFTGAMLGLLGCGQGDTANTAATDASASQAPESRGNVATDGGVSDASPAPGVGENETTTGECKPAACSDKEAIDYIACRRTQCRSEHSVCFGPDHANGNYDGYCRDHVKCVRACPCGDSACVAACGAPPNDCTKCMADIETCADQKCAPPACYPSRSAGDAGPLSRTCDDLKACCFSLGDPQIAATCNALYNAVKSGGDSACDSAYQTYKNSGDCP